MSNADEIARAIANTLRKIEQKVDEAVTEIAMDLLQRSKDLTPVDTGDLKASGHVSKEGKTTSIGYATPYALRQHEELEFKHPNGGQAKYLSQPFEQNIQRYIQHIADKVKTVL